MAVVSSLSTAVELLKRNPVLFVAGGLVALVNGVVAAGQMLASGVTYMALIAGSYAVQLLSLFVVAGAYGMVDDALDGTARLETLVSDGKEYFVNALIGTILFAVVAVLTFVVVGGVGFLGIVGVLTSGSAPGLSMELLMVGMGLVYLFAALPLFFLQFFLPAIVVSDRGPVEALKQSFGLVRGNVLSTLGFDAVVVVVMLVGSLPSVLLYGKWMSTMPTGAAGPATINPFAGLTLATVGPYVAATVVVGTLTGTFFYTYQVAFYDELVADGDEAADEEEIDFDTV
jgi:hypothetical protein